MLSTLISVIPITCRRVMVVAVGRVHRRRDRYRLADRRSLVARATALRGMAYRSGRQEMLPAG